MTIPMTIAVQQARIFVADKDRAIVALMQDLLQGEGYAVTALRSAPNAYHEIVRSRPDLVILDITLERFGEGWLLLDTLRRNSSTAYVPVIVCSADVAALRTRQEELAALGCVSLEKPFDIDILLAAVAKGLADRREVETLQAQHKEPYRGLRVLDGVAV
jgi:DNA-binding response OmpR family regulator